MTSDVRVYQVKENAAGVFEALPEKHYTSLTGKGKGRDGGERW